MNPTRLRRTVQDERHDLATAAARAGVEYALGQLTKNQQWRGSGNGITVQSEHLVVREERGNVFGWMRPDGGEWAAFRLRFNYQDGTPGLDGLPDPTRMIASEAISYNNLYGRTRLSIPLGTGANFAFAGQRGFTVPEHSVALVVEGVVGNGLAPDQPVPTGNAPTVTRTLEAIYQISNLSEGMPQGAVLQAGGDSRFVLGSAGETPEDFSGHLRLAASEQTALMRTKGSSIIAQGAGKTAPFNFYPDMHSEVRVGQPVSFTPRTKDGQEFTRGTEEANAALIEIEWDKVSTSDQPGRLRLPAGVYAIADDDSSGRVRYFPMTFAEYRQTLVSGGTPASADVPEDFLDCVQLDAPTGSTGSQERRNVVTFDRDVEVTTVGNLKDFAIVPLAGAKQKARSTFTATVPLSRFETLHPNERGSTGDAIVSYLQNASGGSGLDFEVDGVVYRNGGFEQGSAAELASAVIGGRNLTFHSPPPAIAGGSLVPSSSFSGQQMPSPGISQIGRQPVYGTPPGLTRGVLFGPSSSNVIAINDPNSLIAASADFGTVPQSVLERNVDPLEIPSSALEDSTVPQDIEVRFTPPGRESATIRGGGNVMLGTHVSGQGGAIVAEGRIDLVGLGLDLNAGQGERDGVSLYSKKNINISTYDERRNKFWDASIKGVLFSKGNLTARLGETVSGGGEPTWGKLDFLGSAIVLGEAPSVIVNPDIPTGQTQAQGSGFLESGFLAGELQVQSGAEPPPGVGNAAMIARGIRLYYEPKFLAPYVEAEQLLPVFSAVSVVER